MTSAALRASSVESDVKSALPPRRFSRPASTTTDAASVVVEAGRLKRRGGSALFTSDSTLDARNAAEVIAEAHQGGLGRPDRDYFLREDDASKQLREHYRVHMARIFVLAGD